jgi:hypothetical protein
MQKPQNQKPPKHHVNAKCQKISASPNKLPTRLVTTAVPGRLPPHTQVLVHTSTNSFFVQIVAGSIALLDIIQHAISEALERDNVDIRMMKNLQLPLSGLQVLGVLRQAPLLRLVEWRQRLLLEHVPFLDIQDLSNLHRCIDEFVIVESEVEMVAGHWRIDVEGVRIRRWVGRVAGWQFGVFRAVRRRVVRAVSTDWAHVLR